MLPKKSTNEENYQYLASILKSADVDTREKAQGHIKGLRDKAIKFSSIPLLVIILGVIFLPQFMPVWVMIVLFGLAWIWLSTYSTIQLIQRYIQKEFD
ncbi:MAG: hypothetical protein ACRBBR_01510 [Cellvibrionaceae bacterium]